MKKRVLLPLVAMMMSGTALAATPSAASDLLKFPPEIQQKQDAIVKNVLSNQKALLNDESSPTVGPAKAKVAVVEFFDYQCLYCGKFAPTLEKVMQAYPDAKFVFKEWPIFGDRWEPSRDAAMTGQEIWKVLGGKAYLAYHNGVFASGHVEGELTKEDIEKAKQLAGYSQDGHSVSTGVSLQQNATLAKKLGLTGTPGIIVMPTEHATAENTTALPGAVPFEYVEAAIKKAGG